MHVSAFVYQSDLGALAANLKDLGISEVLLYVNPDFFWQVGPKPGITHPKLAGCKIAITTWCFTNLPAGGTINPWNASQGQWATFLNNVREWSARVDSFVFDTEFYPASTGGVMDPATSWLNPDLLLTRGADLSRAVNGKKIGVVGNIQTSLSHSNVTVAVSNNLAGFWRKAGMTRWFAEDTYEWLPANLKSRIPILRGPLVNHVNSAAALIPGLGMPNKTQGITKLESQLKAVPVAWLYGDIGLQDAGVCGQLKAALKNAGAS